MQDALALELPAHADDVETVVSAARREKDIEKRLDAVDVRWSGLRVTVETPVGAVGGHEAVPVLTSATQDVMVAIHDMQLELQVVLQSRFVTPHRERCAATLREVSLGEAQLAATLELQAGWTRLRGIFRAGGEADSGGSLSKKTRSSFDAAEAVCFPVRGLGTATRPGSARLVAGI